MLYAKQRNYLVQFIHIGYLIIMNLTLKISKVMITMTVSLMLNITRYMSILILSLLKDIFMDIILKKTQIHYQVYLILAT